MADSREGSPRPAYIELLDAYRGGRSWFEVHAAAGVNPRTADQWVSGKTKEPPMIGMLRIARELGVPPEEFMAAVVAGEMRAPPLAERVARLERMVLNRASDEEVLELERQLGEVLADPESRADAAL